MLYGHPQPSLFYTDNMVDRSFLESIFPSLHQDVIPVEKYSHLSIFEIPSDIKIDIRKTPSAIDDAMRQILDALVDENSKVVVGFDTEWNTTGTVTGGVVSCGNTAIIQIAHEKVVYILQVSGTKFD